jgi:hypothetical protein
MCGEHVLRVHRFRRLSIFCQVWYESSRFGGLRDERMASWPLVQRRTMSSFNLREVRTNWRTLVENHPQRAAAS